MEEDQAVQKHITVTETIITFADGTRFHASPTLLQKLNERVNKEQMITLPQEMPDCNFSIQWIEE
jgi:hypothetical protein